MYRTLRELDVKQTTVIGKAQTRSKQRGNQRRGELVLEVWTSEVQDSPNVSRLILCPTLCPALLDTPCPCRLPVARLQRYVPITKSQRSTDFFSTLGLNIRFKKSISVGSEKIMRRLICLKVHLSVGRLKHCTSSKELYSCVWNFWHWWMYVTEVNFTDFN